MSAVSPLMSLTEIDEILEKIRRKLAHIPDFQVYDMLVRMRSTSDVKSDSAASKAPSAPPERSYILTTPELKARIVRACQAYFKTAKNNPTTIRHLVAILQHQDIEVPGKNPGTTLGAILANHPAFEICDKKKGLWRPSSSANGYASDSQQRSSTH